MVDSTNIIPRFMCLVHSQTDHYEPQIGLPLVNYLEMPTLSTYVFENHDSIDKNGRLVPSRGLTWPNPEWGEKVVSIREYAHGARRGTTPPNVADEVERLSRSSLDAIAESNRKAGNAKTRQKELANILKLMEMNSWLGLHFAEKIRAGIAWESWKCGHRGAKPEDVLNHLDRSIEHWKKLCDASNDVAPDPVWFWQSRVPDEPPWDHWDLWNNYHWVKIHWRDMTPIFERERALVSEQLKGSRETARLPLFPEMAR
jgi:hypothetical protein